MKKLVFAACAAMSIGGAAQAASLDFTDAAFASTFPSSGVTSTATSIVDGVTFTVEATDARGVNGFRQDANGLRFGVPGNGMYTITISADQDVTFESMSGIDTSLRARTTSMLFDAYITGGAMVLSDVAFPETSGTVDFADFDLDAGESLVFAADFSARTGFSSIFASAALTSFSFSKATTPQPSAVPLPAGMPLLLAALGSFAWIRRRSS